MQKYRQPGLKLTPQRLAILKYLDGNKDHPSAENIYKAVSKEFPMMSFATVYNTLETLKKRGSVQELTIDPQKKRFDHNPKPHHHLICIDCKKIVDVHNEFQLNGPKIEDEDFEIIGNHIEFYGLCSQCRKEKTHQKNR
jgi:Fur family transcriptional regulator, peroxide stress response regulator